MRRHIEIVGVVVFERYDQYQLVRHAFDFTLGEALFLFRRFVDKGDIVERNEVLEISARDSDHYTEDEYEHGDPFFGYRLADEVESRGDYPLVLGLIDPLVEQHDEDRLYEYDREQRQYNALCQHETEVVTYAVVHEEQRDEAADRGQSAREDGFERLGHRVHERDFGILEYAHLFVVGVHQEYRVVHRDRELQDDRARRSYRRYGADRVARDDVGAHVEQYRYTERGKEDERLEIALRGEQKYDEYDRDGDGNEFGHIVERAVHEYTRVLRHTGDVIAHRRIVDLRYGAVVDARLQQVVYMRFYRVESGYDCVVGTALREVHVEYVSGIAVGLLDELVRDLLLKGVEIAERGGYELLAQTGRVGEIGLQVAAVHKIVERTYPNDVFRKKVLALDLDIYQFCIVIDIVDYGLNIISAEVGNAESRVAHDPVLFGEILLADDGIGVFVEIGQHVAFLFGKDPTDYGKSHQKHEHAENDHFVFKQPFGEFCHNYSLSLLCAKHMCMRPHFHYEYYNINVRRLTND